MHVVSPGGSDGKESVCSAGHPGSIPGSGGFPGEGNSYPLQYSYLENSMEREIWQVTVHGFPKSQTHTHTHTHTHTDTHTHIYISIIAIKIFNFTLLIKCLGFPGGAVVKNHLPMQETQV